MFLIQTLSLYRRVVMGGFSMKRSLQVKMEHQSEGKSFRDVLFGGHKR